MSDNNQTPWAPTKPTNPSQVLAGNEITDAELEEETKKLSLSGVNRDPWTKEWGSVNQENVGHKKPTPTNDAKKMKNNAKKKMKKNKAIKENILQENKTKLSNEKSRSETESKKTSCGPKQTLCGAFWLRPEIPNFESKEKTVKAREIIEEISKNEKGSKHRKTSKVLPSKDSKATTKLLNDVGNESKQNDDEKLAEQFSSSTDHKKDRVNSSLKNKHGNDSLLICYDLEFSDGSSASEVFQLGAKCISGSFSRNVLPQEGIHWGVTKVTKITVKRDACGCRQLYDTKLKEFLPSLKAKNSYSDFLKWIEDQKTLGQYENVILIAHGNKDMLVLVNNYARAGLMEDLLKVVDFFADSLEYFQNTCKTWTEFSLSSVYGYLFPDREAFNAHSAIEDATALHDILEKLTSEYSKEAFLLDIKSASVKSSLCVQITKNEILKTIAKSTKKKKDQNNFAIKFLAPDLGNLPNPVELLNKLNRGAPVNYLSFRCKEANYFITECVIDGKTFLGKGKKKKEAELDCALKVLDEVHHTTY